MRLKSGFLALTILLAGCATTPVIEPEPMPMPLSQAVPLLESIPPEQAPPPLPETAPTGSLWNNRQAMGSLYRDLKAHQVGDIVTIVVSEESQASKSSTTQTDRSGKLSGGVEFPGITTPKGTVGGPYGIDYGLKYGKEFSGTGATSKSDSMMAYMTATVVQVLPNDNLVIRGSRWTKVNAEMQQIVLEGVVRPVDITRSNTILSQNIADAKIFFVGKGPLSKHQRPGWLGQVVDIVSPF